MANYILVLSAHLQSYGDYKHCHYCNANLYNNTMNLQSSSKVPEFLINITIANQIIFIPQSLLISIQAQPIRKAIRCKAGSLLNISN